MLQKSIGRIKSTYKEYPRQFWILMGSSFIDALGGALLYPFFALYVTRTFSVGLSQVGLIFASLTVTSMIGTTLGSGLADRFGRKSMAIFGLVANAFSILALGFVKELDAVRTPGCHCRLDGQYRGPFSGGDGCRYPA